MTPDQTNLNTELWKHIESFDLDYPISAYNFSTRLASENNWTKYFTQKAILEYKKFMYLAANAGVMISPSETVDKVWHLHLIFTKSYADFGSLTGKTIHHVPSTRAADEHSKFQQAKQNTERLYNHVFGDMPQDIWLHDDVYGPLGWEKRTSYLSVFVIVGILVAAILLFPLYFLLNPLYIHIHNPYFLIGYISFIALTFFALYRYNTSYLHNLLNEVKEGSFLHHLQPAEVIYLKSQQTVAIIHNSVNNLIEEGKIEIAPDGTLRTISFSSIETTEEFAIKESVQEAGGFHYRILLRHMASKAVFSNTVHAMRQFQKQFRESKQFGRLYRINFMVLTALTLPGVIRVITGLERNKPVGFLFATLFILLLLTGGSLSRLTRFLFTDIIPNWYKYHLLPNNPGINQYEWLYFLSGTGALSASLIPLVTSLERNNTLSGDGGSGCGSSCGGGCGGAEVVVAAAVIEFIDKDVRPGNGKKPAGDRNGVLD